MKGDIWSTPFCLCFSAQMAYDQVAMFNFLQQAGLLWIGVEWTFSAMQRNCGHWFVPVPAKWILNLVYGCHHKIKSVARRGNETSRNLACGASNRWPRKAPINPNAGDYGRRKIDWSGLGNDFKCNEKQGIWSWNLWPTVAPKRNKRDSKKSGDRCGSSILKLPPLQWPLYVCSCSFGDVLIKTSECSIGY